MRTDISLIMGGPQGGGVESASAVLLRAIAQAGYYAYGKREYFSNIKGRHSYFHLRIRDKPTFSIRDPVDLLVCLDAETMFTHFTEVVKDGAVIFDPSIIHTKVNDVVSMEDELKERIELFLENNGLPKTIEGVINYLSAKSVQLYQLPYGLLLQEVNKTLGPAVSSALMRYINTMAVAASAAVMNLAIENVQKGLESVFGRKIDVIKPNIVAAQIAYNYAKEHFFNFRNKLDQQPLNVGPRLLVNGNEIIAMGKIAGGLRFQTYYPITPAADESFYIEAHNVLEDEKDMLKNAGIVVVQTEDEISAITMATGAALTGVRAATATSGPGFSLMAEGLSWAGMNEVPVVITHYQRGGPSTGLPTRDSQSDLHFALNAGHGEFPRIVISSGDHYEAFYDAIKAFNYAERYQLPVIHIVEKALANSYATIPVPDISNIKIDRGLIYLEEEVEKASIIPGFSLDDGVADQSYKRFRFTENGISPRALLGISKAVYWNTGDEHNEYGHISEDPVNRKLMYEKRMKKLETAAKEIPRDDKLRFYGSEEADVTLVGWGTTKGAILDAMEALQQLDNISVNFLQIKIFSPFPSVEVSEILSRSKLIIDIENNYNAIAAGIIGEKTGIRIKHHIVKYTGRPMSETEVYEAVKRILLSGEGRVVLTHGA
ncbi:MAG: 2-oxoacid:ferredoxin oxidoreductase subunit alpha [Thermoprotei archaeon]